MIITTSRVSIVREHLRQRLVERACLLLRVADGGEDLRAVLARDVGGVVGAVVGHDHDPVRGLVCSHNDASEASMVRLSSCAGTRTVSRNGLRGVLDIRQFAGGEAGSSTSRTVAGPSGVSMRLRSRRLSGERGGGIRRSRARTRIAAAACRAASPKKTAPAATTAASMRCRQGMLSLAPSGSWPTIFAGCARRAIHAATNSRTRVAPISATDNQLNRATRRPGGTYRWLPSGRPWTPTRCCSNVALSRCLPSPARRGEGPG